MASEEIPHGILNVNGCFVNCQAIVSCLEQLLNIVKVYLERLTLNQCIDLLNNFHDCFEFVISITKNNELMHKLEHLESINSKTGLKSQQFDFDNIAKYLYKIEAMSIENSLNILFLFKQVAFDLKQTSSLSLRKSSIQREISNSDSMDSSDNENDNDNNISLNGNLSLEIDENVKSQIIENNTRQFTPPPSKRYVFFLFFCLFVCYSYCLCFDFFLFVLFVKISE